jgi:hypothetical protein
MPGKEQAMRRYTIVLLALIAALAIASTGLAQPYKFDVAPKAAPVGHVVRISLENRLNTTIYLPPMPMWAIYDSANRLVYLEPGYTIYMPVRPYATATWPWNQRDQDNRQVEPGYYEARCYYSTGPGSPYLKKSFQIRETAMIVEGDARPGSKLDLGLYSKKSAGRSYRVALAFGNKTGIKLPVGRTFPLNYDQLFVMSLTVGAPVFQKFAGWLDENGTAKAAILFPNQPALRGYTFYAAFATFDPEAPGGVLDFSQAAEIRIR